MITVIIAGGSGTRLWPLSTSINPKQLLKLTNDYSMVQNTYNRATTFSKEIYVVPDTSHAEALKAQLPVLDEDHCIVEPGRRGTAHCILATLAHIERSGHDLNEPIAFISADHHVRDVEGFARCFQTVARISQEKNKIVLIGIEPTYPATGFGYIEKDGAIDDAVMAHKVESFKEKPDFKTATKYMQSGKYLWNCGYFVGSVNTFLAEIRQSTPDLLESYEKIKAAGEESPDHYKEVYLSLDNKVIDTALIEKAKDLIVVPANFDWMDVGNFKDLHEANQGDEQRNVLHGEDIHTIDVENAYIRNEEQQKPVAVIGLDNVVVINTKDGILVARKDLSPQVGEIAKKIQGQG